MLNEKILFKANLMLFGSLRIGLSDERVIFLVVLVRLDGYFLGLILNIINIMMHNGLTLRTVFR